MCIIAGYSGNKPAAPILIEMMKKQEYIDGGLSTGIATIHEGKLYVRKVVGDVETLLRETDALDLPGTTGIMHSRTGADSVAHAHPFTSNDENIALITNGTTGEANCDAFYERANEIMAHFYNKGYNIKTAYTVNEGTGKKTKLPNGQSYMFTEPYLFIIEEALEGCPEKDLKREIAKATRKAINTLPRAFVTANIHAKIPDTITIGNVTRPVSIGFGDGETYFASVAIAFPDDIQKRPIIHLPPTCTAQVTPNGLEIISTSIENARVEQIDYRIAASIRTRMEELLLGRRDDPLSIYDMPFWTDWADVWTEPYRDSIFDSGKGYLKPYAAILYECFWSFHKEGRLRMTLGRKTKKPDEKITRFWIE